MGILVVNLNRNKQSVRHVLDTLLSDQPQESISVLDFTGSLTEGLERVKEIIPVRLLDKDSRIEKRSIEDLFQYGAALSRQEISNGHSIREVRFRGFPLFWLTQLGFRHYYYTWGESVFFLLNFFRERSEYFASYPVIRIVLQDDCTHLAVSVETVLKKWHRDVRVVFPLLDNENPWRSYFTVLKRVVTGVLYSRAKGRSASVPGPDADVVLVTNVPQTWSASQKKDLVLGNISRFQKHVQYLPLFDDLKSATDWEREWGPKTYRSRLLSIGNLAFFCFQSLRCFLRIKNLKVKDFTYEVLPLNGNAVRIELLRSLVSNLISLYQISSIPLSLPESKNKIKVFYQDELYPVGRMLSYFLSGRADTYGCQHGLITQYDLVYKMSDMELEDHLVKDDRLPTPGHFVVWGEYFKKVIRKGNSIPDERVISAGNIKRPEKKGRSSASVGADGKVHMLWCANMPVYSEKEFSLMEKFLIENKEYELTIRMHPSFDIRDLVRRKLEKLDIRKGFTFSHHSAIEDDIALADVVITNDVSSVYLDSILMGVPVIRIKSRIFLSDAMELDRDSSILIDVENEDEFIAAMAKISSMKSEEMPGYIREYEAGSGNWNRIFR